jgi:hypothetical protein
MRRTFLAFSAIAASAAVSLPARDAAACGGCFVQQSESTQVSGHRMALSVSPAATTLWDQITYAGDPASFAWVLPTKGVVDVGLSSDAMFGTLDALTQVIVASPQCPCAAPTPDSSSGVGSGGSGGGDGGVEVIAEEVVGPFETVQLSANDPTALADWLASHAYAIPAEVQPVIAAYVAEGFNFLAMKLVPGTPVTSMQPVRVTSPGAGLWLPLRMVAAGTGVTTPISLWVIGEGRYEPQNFPWFTIDAADLVWDWDTSSSNYKALRQAAFDDSGGLGWLVEVSGSYGSWDLTSLCDLAAFDPEASGYGSDATEAVAACDDDVAALLNGNAQPWITRLYAELPQVGFEADLALVASADQSIVSGFLQATQEIGTSPCPDCSGSTTTGGAGGGTGFGGDDATVATGTSSSSSSGGVDGQGGAPAADSQEVGGCAVSAGSRDAASAFAGALLAAAAVARRARRRARRP